MNPRLLRRLVYCLFAVCACAAFGEVRLPNLLSDHAVLQRKTPIHIWGWAAPGEHIVVTLHKQKQTASTDELGKWSVYLMPEDAGGPYQMTIAGTNTVTLSDVLLRRVPVALGACWSSSCSRESSTRVAMALGWNDEETARELESFEIERSGFLNKTLPTGTVLGAVGH